MINTNHATLVCRQFIQMKIDLEKILGNDVDLVSSRGISKYIKPLIDSKKRLIYEK